MEPRVHRKCPLVRGPGCPLPVKLMTQENSIHRPSLSDSTVLGPRLRTAEWRPAAGARANKQHKNERRGQPLNMRREAGQKATVAGGEQLLARARISSKDHGRQAFLKENPSPCHPACAQAKGDDKCDGERRAARMKDRRSRPGSALQPQRTAD